MQIIEQFILGKEGNPDTCEDGLIMTENLIAVIDGVTAKSAKRLNGVTSGVYAKNILSKILLQPGIEKLCKEDLFLRLHEGLKSSCENDFAELDETAYPRASMIVYNNRYCEIWNYGDCQCVINGKVYTHSKEIDELNSNLRAFYLEYAMLDGMCEEALCKHDLGREKITDNLKMQFSFENKDMPFGYPVLNGITINLNMIKSYQIKAEDEIVLASDGYPVLKPSLIQSEANLKYILENDPMCYRLYRSTKGLSADNVSFDDRCYCRFVV